MSEFQRRRAALYAEFPAEAADYESEFNDLQAENERLRAEVAAWKDATLKTSEALGKAQMAVQPGNAFSKREQAQKLNTVQPDVVHEKSPVVDATHQCGGAEMKWNPPSVEPPRRGWYLVSRDGEQLVRAWGNGHWWIPLPDGWLSADGVYEWQQPCLAELDEGDGSPLAECERVTDSATACTCASWIVNGKSRHEVQCPASTVSASEVQK